MHSCDVEPESSSQPAGMYSAVYSYLFGSVPHTCTFWHAWAKRRLEPITWITQGFLLLACEGMQGKSARWQPLKFIAKFGSLKFGECAWNLVKTCRKEVRYAYIAQSYLSCTEWNRLSSIPHCVSRIQGAHQGTLAHQYLLLESDLVWLCFSKAKALFLEDRLLTQQVTWIDDVVQCYNLEPWSVTLRNQIGIYFVLSNCRNYL